MLENAVFSLLLENCVYRIQFRVLNQTMGDNNYMQNLLHQSKQVNTS